MPGKIDGVLRCPLRSFFERVQDVDRLDELRDIEKPVRCIRLDADLLDACPHARHWPPVVRLQTALHSPKLESGNLPSVVRKGPDRLSRVPRARPRPYQSWRTIQELGCGANATSHCLGMQPMTYGRGGDTRPSLDMTTSTLCRRRGQCSWRACYAARPCGHRRSQLTGMRELFDSPSFYYPAAMCLAGMLAVLLAPRYWWVAVIGIILGDRVYSFVMLGETRPWVLFGPVVNALLPTWMPAVAGAAGVFLLSRQLTRRSGGRDESRR